MFSPTVTDFWQKQFRNGEIVFRDDALSVAVNPDLAQDRRVMLVKVSDGDVMATVTPAMAGRLKLDRREDLTEQLLRQRLAEIGIVMHGADYVFYFPEAERAVLRSEDAGDGVRWLTGDDAAVFAEFAASASEQDLDDAYVELDHWAVFGAFEQNRLVCAASMYPWQNSRLADVGVLTLPPYRGRGHARRVVRAISRHALDQDHEPQYRCQTDHEASIAVAAAAGLTLFGTWEVVSEDSPDSTDSAS